MRITRSQLEKAIRETVENESLSGDLRVRVVANAFVKYLGIEIVPDPGPELPPRPWSFGHKKGHGFWIDPGHYLYRDGEQLIHRVCLQPMMSEDHDDIAAILEALVSAYNAAGERKRIEVREFGKSGLLGNRKFTVNGKEVVAVSYGDAIGDYIERHADELGFEVIIR